MLDEEDVSPITRCVMQIVARIDRELASRRTWPGWRRCVITAGTAAEGKPLHDRRSATSTKAREMEIVNAQRLSWSLVAHTGFEPVLLP